MEQSAPGTRPGDIRERTRVEKLLDHFQFGHLPPELMEVSRPFLRFAHDLAASLPDGPELETALLRLVEAKDWAVRARVTTMDRGSLGLSASGGAVGGPREPSIREALAALPDDSSPAAAGARDAHLGQRAESVTNAPPPSTTHAPDTGYVSPETGGASPETGYTSPPVTGSSGVGGATGTVGSSGAGGGGDGYIRAATPSRGLTAADAPPGI